MNVTMVSPAIKFGVVEIVDEVFVHNREIDSEQDSYQTKKESEYSF